MKKLFPFFIGIGCCFSSYSQTLQQVEANKVTLPNGWSLTPVGRSFPLGDLPLNIALSRSKKLMAVTNNGQGVQSIQLIDPFSEKVLDNVIIPKSWYGLQFSADEKTLYASAGNDNWITEYAVENKKLVLKDSIKLGDKWPNKISPAGIAVDDAAHLMYVVTKDDRSLYIVDLVTKKVQQQYSLGGEAYACVLSPDRKELYISCWGCDKIYVFDTGKKNVTSEIQVGDNPNELCLSKNGKYLYVANSNDNSVSVINVAQRRVLEVLNAALYPDAPNGSTTNGLALSDNEKTLYIANADNNCVTVFDVSDPGQSKSRGFILVGWYPTNVKVVGKKLFVSNGKGFSSMANPYGPNPFINRQQVVYQQGDLNKPIDVQYIAGLFKGTMTVLEEPTDKQLSVYSQVVYRNTPYNKLKELLAQGEDGNPIPRKVGDQGPIKYVFYVIKENRTYDQVLGDIKEGNGDPSLVLFGENITPNQHALAREFVLLDNFYVDGEVSADGHNWSTGAYATDFLEKNWVTSYGGRGGAYDAEGNRAVANNKGGFIWDHCKRAGVTYRTYGEFADNYKPNIPSLKGHLCPYFTGYDNKVQDTVRFGQWKREFDSLLSVNAVPRFNSVRFCNDHTEGMRKGRPTPYAHVADNDLAVGLFVEHLSKSPIWKETAVFILEDDAQNGADHVDAHRSTAYVAGGFVKRGYVDHTMYSTSSMLRTIELILGIPPMSQYDAAATPMWRCFTGKADLTPFTARPATVNLLDKNIAMNEWQRRSENFNLTKEDAVPDLEFNKVLWHGLKGDHVPFPGPKRAAFFKAVPKAEKDRD
ncbi:MAG: bifunctional YncE family protein/alkaline phosphatase family protein [Chitinophagaceae bacterium]|nr:bifunctional YncE family protein/alkaline phosphatase family protein [Chitinophagaceae bacterium]MCA6453904.1 bifunctional YncE family protein/alkaline phosphatase family protein [Chitinophagaceae bacterium]MCA6454903.1 bifunctional YncE family protein/alkaline phosphatase family protein [Chitinophagaceae bacterium]MCA6458698.1 bifunctional YncE family protein/alkaline phosphatase family protein [Chitinophagaceae bacterium]MCA6464206.1 bifunctional YncE family protein/alkaline phosphatase fa